MAGGAGTLMYYKPSEGFFQRYRLIIVMVFAANMAQQCCSVLFWDEGYPS